ASLRGHVVRGPMIGRDQAYVSVPAWLGPPPPHVDRPEGLARLGRRYLAGHGPATAADLAKWAGVTLGDARRGMDAIAGELTPSGGPARLAARTDRAAPRPAPRLLGPFHPL